MQEMERAKESNTATQLGKRMFTPEYAASVLLRENRTV